MIDILLSAFLLSLVLLGIHSYYGLHIIRRGIIFTDLAIGQMAAFGAAVSIFFFHAHYLYIISLIFALIGASLIAITAKKNISHEAFIGLVYALGISAAVILLSKSPRGTEDFQKLLASDILFVSYHEVIKTAILYTIIGLFLFFIVDKTKGVLHEFLFFLTFAITVTSSVNLTGVLVVFSILVAPAYIISFFRKSFCQKLIGAWIIGTIINSIAIVISYYMDFPTGYTIIALYSLLGIIIATIKKQMLLSNDTLTECMQNNNKK
ncbi:MAG: ABC transporter [Candidatus Fischerbacteria bacterium RBG_13_37_8]|uniref:ABC transporter n=1 Tax=Candidatus Fischerbacteria bacterium RBG_13_37_8 TaxID=1817863 RepID=A0A1F5VVW1_9BACT|nr:MAG: ABC transporter [Candidatus Fischerbacteria bacterium RBG_13_37_8]